MEYTSAKVYGRTPSRNPAYWSQVQRIKRDLIRTAKVKKDYAKLKGGEAPASTEEIHPERQAMLAQPDTTSDPLPEINKNKKRNAKPRPLEKEHRQAQLEKERRDLEYSVAQEKQQERKRKQEEYQRFRKSVEKARRPDKNGQRRLGRECKLLPQMVEGLLKRLGDT